ncbi:MAG: tetratricopeptide repeat protein [Prevotellaceae bacterium]|jgi:DNA-binding CsgD family transcriptional regulator|nr:tetratricopeptide repeat protein [Prevotellaceae bacterium]
MKTFLKSIGLLLFFVLINCCFSCKRQADDVLFSEVENILEQQPDSALHLLQSILFPEDLNKSRFNKYSLLTVQAKDKSYRDITADTLIFAVKDYYVQREDYPNATLAAFYCGRVLYEQKNIKEAATAYFAAEKLAKHIKNNNLKGLIQGNLGILYCKQSLNDEAIIRGKNAVVLYNKATNYKNEINALRLIGDCFLLDNKADSAFYYYNESLRLADYHKTPAEQSYARASVALSYRQTGAYKKAKELLWEAITFKIDSIEQARIFMNLAQVYILENKLDSAKLHIERSLIFKPDETDLLVSIYSTLSTIAEKESNYKEAYQYFKTHTAYQKKIINGNKSVALLELQEKYDFETLKNENNRIVIEKQSLLLISSLVLLLVSFFAFIFYWKWIQGKQMKIEIEQKMETLKKMADSYSDENDSFRNMLLHHFNILKKVALIENSISEDNRKKGELLIKKFNKIVYEQDTLNWNLLYQTMNNLRNGFYDQIQKQYPQLSEQEFRICSLTCEKFTDTEISTIMGISINMVRKIRSRIRKKIGMPMSAHDYSIYNFFEKNRS